MVVCKTQSLQAVRAETMVDGLPRVHRCEVVAPALLPVRPTGWGRRPFELATLRLQNLVDIQIKHWDELKPVDDRCLTQLGGCTIVSDDGVPIYSWLDTGLCDIPDFDKLLSEL